MRGSVWFLSGLTLTALAIGVGLLLSMETPSQVLAPGLLHPALMTPVR